MSSDPEDPNPGGPTRLTTVRDGTELSVLDYGGSGAGLVLLHGIAGHGGEWLDTSEALSPQVRVIASDARGHGLSGRHPEDLSPAAFADDVAHIVETLELGPAILVGQSLGGQTALLVTARRPELVKALVLVEAGPDPITSAEIGEVEAFLFGWPTPFDSREAAVAHFGGPSLRATRWADGLEVREDGLWPRFDPAVMVDALRAAEGRDLWDSWEAVDCPTLVVRAGDGSLPPEELARMREARPGIEVEEIADAGHDVHLDAVGKWRSALSRFERDHR